MSSKAKKIIRNIILIICIITFVSSASFLLYYYLIIPTGEKNVYADLREANSEVEAQLDTDIHSSQLKPDYSAALEINDETVGWLRIPGTSIDYPVVQHPDDEKVSADYYYYLSHNFEKKRSIGGAVFLDYRNNATSLDSNTIVWGHNVYNRRNLEPILSDLDKYEDIDFYKDHPVIEFNTLENFYKWKIYAVFATNQMQVDDNGYVFNFFYPNISGGNFEGYINEVNKRTLYHTGVDVKDDDKFLTLITCYRGFDTSDYRAPSYIVVVARQVREGEDATVDTSVAVKNNNPKYPQIYYDKYGLANPYIYDKKWYPLEV